MVVLINDESLQKTGAATPESGTRDVRFCPRDVYECLQMTTNAYATGGGGAVRLARRGPARIMASPAEETTRR